MTLFGMGPKADVIEIMNKGAIVADALLQVLSEHY
jgi:hypothetical protein